MDSDTVVVAIASKAHEANSSMWQFTPNSRSRRQSTLKQPGFVCCSATHSYSGIATMTEALELANKRLTELNVIVAELRSTLHNGAGVSSQERVAPDHVRSNASAAQSSSAKKRPRSVTACNKCRALKIRCERDAVSKASCSRCAELDIPCEVEKCKRGRVRGSKNKDKTLAFRFLETNHFVPAAQQSDVPHSSDGNADKPEVVDEKQPEVDDSFDPLSTGERLQLPLESARHSPEVEDRHLRDGPHPLSLLSNVAWSMLSNSENARYDDCLSAHSTGVADETQPSEGADIAIMPGWTSSQLGKAAKQKQAYYRYGMNAIKRDVAPKLDPIVRGLIGEIEAEQLVDGFFRCLQPQVGIMDPDLHTVEFLRTHSCLLLTAVLAAAAQTNMDTGSRNLSRTLYLHTERLFLIAISSDAKSPEIVLAFLVLYLWPKFPEQNVDDRSRIFLTLAINMSVELGFPRLPRDIDGNLFQRRQHRNLIRTWTALYIHDRSLSAFSGRPPLIKAHAGADEMRSWLQDRDLVTKGDFMIVGYLELRALENESRTRLAEITQPYLANAVKHSALTQLESWTQEWCGAELHGSDFANMMEFVAIHLSLLIHSKGVVEQDTRLHHEQLQHLAKKSLDFLLLTMSKNAKFTCRTVCAMITWNAVVYLKLAGDAARDTVRSVGLALAPFGDGRMDQAAAHFYGSLLLELSFDKGISAGDGPHNPLYGVMPSPSTLWVLQQSIVPARGDIPSRALVPSNVPLSDSPPSNQPNPSGLDLSTTADITEPAFSFDFPMWGDLSQRSSGLSAGETVNLQQIFTPAVEQQQEWQGMSTDWSWLFDNTSAF